jgi:hypothetical protein
MGRARPEGRGRHPFAVIAARLMLAAVAKWFEMATTSASPMPMFGSSPMTYYLALR